MSGRRVALAFAASLCAAIAPAGPVAAHPLGNASVNRAVSLLVAAEALAGRYIIDMAEIPAFAAITKIDLDGDGRIQTSEAEAFGGERCLGSLAGLDLRIDGSRLVPYLDGAARLTFPPGVGGLETLRLECPFRASWPTEMDASPEHRLVVSDLNDDGSLGWREVTMAAAADAILSASDVPSSSPSQALTAYPQGSLASPLDVRGGSASVRLGETGARPMLAPTVAGDTARPGSDALAMLAQAPSSAPLAALGLLMSLGLGAAHALSPGHGKTVVAAYLLGSQATLRHAAALGIIVAASHTAGVLVLTAATLVAGELLAPDRLIELLSAASGVLVVLLGAGLLIRGVRGQGGAQRDADLHEHPLEHAAHVHSHRDGHRDGQVETARGLRARHLAALGLAGGMIPSASAVIVLLVAITTGQLLYGLAIVGAFGLGMAAVLAGIAVMSGWARQRLMSAPGERFAGRLARIGPLVSGGAVVVTGVVITVSAAAKLV